MSARSLTAIGAATASLLSLSAVLFAGPASAAPDCSAAVRLAVKAAATAQAAGADDLKAADAQKLYDVLAAAKVELDAAIKADNAAVPPATVDSARTVAAKAALIKAQADVDAFVKLGVTLEVVLGTAAKTDAVALLRLSVEARAAVRVACKDTTTPTPTVSPTVSTPVVTDPPQVVVVPDTSDGVDTGSW